MKAREVRAMSNEDLNSKLEELRKEFAFSGKKILPDAVSCWIPLGVVEGNEDASLYQSFHFDEGVTNWAQGDMLTFTEEFWAVQDRNNDLGPPDTGSGRVWSEEEKKCADCSEGVAWLYAVDENNQGTTKNGGAIAPSRSDENSRLGQNDSVFFSLGKDGSVVVRFSFKVEDGAGDDLVLYEITYGNRLTYPEERADVEISQDGITWTTLGTATSHLEENSFDLSGTGLSWFRYVKVTDVTDFGPHSGGADGFEIDAIKGIYGSCGQ